VKSLHACFTAEDFGFGCQRLEAAGEAQQEGVGLVAFEGLQAAVRRERARRARVPWQSTMATRRWQVSTTSAPLRSSDRL
jgi:hypothetical protein